MPSPKNSDFQQLLVKAVAHYQQQLPFVIYRKPSENTVKGIFQKTDETLLVDEFTEVGFVFAPFDWDDKKVLLRPDETESSIYDNHTKSNYNNNSNTSFESNKNQYFELFSKAEKEIETRNLEKVVISRKIGIPFSGDVFILFERMLQKYNGAFCYLWFHPKIGQWLGATPELLLKMDGQELHAVALAGTKLIKPLAKPIWKQKELREQKLVTDYVLKCFQNELKSVEISETETVRAGKLLHLKSTISGRKPADFSLANLLSKLHPTPAVCGLPKTKAYDFIKASEGYNREYYTGFLGELNIDSSSQAQLYVNLRCLQIKDNTANIYVGGGITSESDVEQEWIETENKSQTMLELL